MRGEGKAGRHRPAEKQASSQGIQDSGEAGQFVGEKAGSHRPAGNRPVRRGRAGQRGTGQFAGEEQASGEKGIASGQFVGEDRPAGKRQDAGDTGQFVGEKAGRGGYRPIRRGKGRTRGIQANS